MREENWGFSMVMDDEIGQQGIIVASSPNATKEIKENKLSSFFSKIWF